MKWDLFFLEGPTGELLGFTQTLSLFAAHKIAHILLSSVLHVVLHKHSFIMHFPFDMLIRARSFSFYQCHYLVSLWSVTAVAYNEYLKDVYNHRIILKLIRFMFFQGHMYTSQTNTKLTDSKCKLNSLQKAVFPIRCSCMSQAYRNSSMKASLSPFRQNVLFRCGELNIICGL